MALTNYGELKTSIETFMERTSDATITGNAADFVTLGEARINRLIEKVSQEAALTSTADSRSISISSLNLIEPISLWRTDGQGRDQEIELKALGSYAQTDITGDPYAAALDEDSLEFNCPLEAGQTFRFVYRGRVKLENDSDTNHILTNHPDVYLAACLFWSGMLTEDSDMAAAYKSLWDEFSRETKNTIAQQRRSTLSPPIGLLQRSGRYRATYTGD